MSSPLPIPLGSADWLLDYSDKLPLGFIRKDIAQFFVKFYCSQILRIDLEHDLLGSCFPRSSMKLRHQFLRLPLTPRAHAHVDSERWYRIPFVPTTQHAIANQLL